MWRISKSFNFEYGHRVWTQELDNELSCSDICKCQMPHGHSGKLVVCLESDKLNEQGMVTDFHNLNWLKKLIDNHLDHRTLLDINDPGLNAFFPITDNMEIEEILTDEIKYKKYKIDDSLVISNVYKIIYDGYVLVDFVPTSENICKWLYDIIQNKLKDTGIKVYSIKFYETVKSSSEYIGG